jgi:hypothetical protein
MGALSILLQQVHGIAPVFHLQLCSSLSLQEHQIQLACLNMYLAFNFFSA